MRVEDGSDQRGRPVCRTWSGFAFSIWGVTVDVGLGLISWGGCFGSFVYVDLDRLDRCSRPGKGSLRFRVCEEHGDTMRRRELEMVRLEINTAA